MSILSDLYISTPNQATHYNTQNPFVTDERIRFSDITIVELSLLWMLVEKREWNPDVMKEFVCLARQAEGDCLIHQFPVPFVRSLASIRPEQISAAAAEWASAPELASTPSALAPLVQALVDLATRALASGRDVFVWTHSHAPIYTPGAP